MLLRMNEKVALILFNIDNFKSVNDTYGYDFGDLALVQLDGTYKSKIEDSSYICKMEWREIHNISTKMRKRSVSSCGSIAFFH